MATQVLSFSRPSLGRRGQVLALGAMALIALAPLSQIGAPDYSALAANRMVEFHTSRLPIQDLAELTKKSDAAVLGRVVSKGAVHFVLPEKQQPRAFTPSAPPTDLPQSKLEGLKDAPAAPPRNEPGLVTPPAGIPVTQFTVEVTRSLFGELKVGQRITLEQAGGDITMSLGGNAPTLTRTIVAEHDPLLVTGQEQVLFVSKGANNTFVVTGGPDGRFSLDARRSLVPVDEGSPVGKAAKGETIDSFASKVKLLRGTN
jgi:hypothetical protein